MTERRLLRVNKANLANKYLNVKDHLDFFPPDIVGGAKRNGVNGHGVSILLDGLGETIITDIPSDAKTGEARSFLRDREGIGRFYRHHGIKPDTLVALVRTSERAYRLSLAPPLRAAEFFAGIGLVRLALEQAGWSVVFANDIDADKAETNLSSACRCRYLLRIATLIFSRRKSATS